jgi:hypothetical protein
MKTEEMKDTPSEGSRVVDMSTYGPSEELAKRTQAYAMVDVKVVATDKYVKVPDIEKGGDRKRRYGIVMSMAAIPNLKDQLEPVMVTQDMPMIMIDADNFEDLEERAIAEVRGMIRILEDTLSGKIVPPTAEDYVE